MRLKTLQAENFKCIEDSNEFTIDQVTCLMGKNEAGKTAILEALYKLNPVEPDQADFNELEYPRRYVTTARQERDIKKDTVLTTKWELNEDDLKRIGAELGGVTLDITEVTARKGYSNRIKWDYKINESAVIQKYIKGLGLNAAEQAQVKKHATVEGLITELRGLSDPPPKLSKLLDQLQADFPDHSVRVKVDTILTRLLPKFVYFDTYHKLPGRVALTALKNRRDHDNLTFPDKIFLALLDLTSTSLDEVEKIGESEKLIMELESIENALTEKIFSYWTQNQHLEVKFRFDMGQPEDPAPFNSGWVFSTRIRNTRHRASVNFGERSTGFVWFFSFLIWFSELQQNYGKNLFLLLDEPGLSLHGKAQQDLLRYMNNELRPDYQVIYTAHSPFMIDVEHVFSIRTVEDVARVREVSGQEAEEILGTKVGNQILSRDEDTLFPLQGIVGFDIAQTFFVGPYVVVVEGPTEAAFIHFFSRMLGSLRDKPLDVRWAVCPAEGAGKVSSFVTLFSGRGLKIASLMDYHDGQKGMVDRLEERGLIPSDHFLRTTDFVGQAEADIEDVVGRELYVELVHRALGLPDHLRIPDDRPEDAPSRVVKEVEQHCRTLPAGFPEFDHYAPAKVLLDLSEEEFDALPGVQQALENFEVVIDKLNSLT